MQEVVAQSSLSRVLLFTEFHRVYFKQAVGRQYE